MLQIVCWKWSRPSRLGIFRFILRKQEVAKLFCIFGYICEIIFSQTAGVGNAKKIDNTVSQCLKMDSTYRPY